MNFFEHQDESRKKTGWLVFLFIAAVIGIILALYALFVAFYYYGTLEESGGTTHISYWQPELFAAVTIGTIIIIMMGSLFKVYQLRKGGSYVAELLGGRPVNPSTKDPKEKMLLNIVQEMSLASGMAVPQVYVMDGESGINAFAAGYSVDDAAVAVTRGCLDTLNRDELQGVIAHEFSHILNGDMRLNIKLIGILSGILIIATIGRIILRSALYAPRRSSGNKKNNPLAGVLLGVAILIIGYVGVLIGRMIQSAISRQREYLADASAVQFTRNPHGISGALKKIGGLSGSKINSPNAEEASHMFFSNALGFSALFATHPPLKERIKRIDPSFDGDYKKASATQAARPSPAMAGAAGFAGGETNSGVQIGAENLAGQAGSLSAENIAYGSAMLAAIPEALRDSLSDPYGAVVAVLGLLLDPKAEKREKQLQDISKMVKPQTAKEILWSFETTRKLPENYRLPLIDLAEPALKLMSPAQTNQFLDLVQKLVESDGELTLFEFSLQKVLESRLKPSSRTAKQLTDINAALPDAIMLLSMLAYSGTDNLSEAEKAFKTGIAKFAGKASASILPQNKISFGSLDVAIGRLRAASPKIQEKLINACAACVLYDGEVTIEEAELLRALAYSINIPLPPFLPKTA